MSEQKSSTIKPATKIKPKNSAQDAQEHRLTDAYAAEARRDSLLEGDELSELEPVGSKASEAAPLQRNANGGADRKSGSKIGGNKTTGTGRR